MKLSRLAEKIDTPKILSFTTYLNQRKKAGEKIYDLTIGDFDPSIFPVPRQMTEYTYQAYQAGQTNYPGAFGLADTRLAIASIINRKCHIDLTADDLFIACGTRPFIYSAYRAIVDEGDKVVYPVPSWNNDQFSSMMGASVVELETTVESNFMPTADSIAPHIKQTVLLALCSPQNPTGTVFKKDDLKQICELVVAENNARKTGEKPLYVLFDQVYWMLTHGKTHFFHALNLCPEIKPYALFVDGMSKAFAATGLRVGWASGPEEIMAKMRAIVAYMGAWAPRPEQAALGQFLAQADDVDNYINCFKERLKKRLDMIYTGLNTMKQQDYPVDAIKPQASIYLPIKLDLLGKRTPQGITLEGPESIQSYILENAKVGILPFSWFGSKTHNCWFRVSVGTCKIEEIPKILRNLESSLSQLR